MIFITIGLSNGSISVKQFNNMFIFMYRLTMIYYDRNMKWIYSIKQLLTRFDISFAVNRRVDGERRRAFAINCRTGTHSAI
jgi:hypothetical protein